MDNEVKEYVNKVSNLLTKEFLADIDLRYDYMADLKNKKMAELSSYSDEDKNKLYDNYIKAMSVRKNVKLPSVYENMIYAEALDEFYAKNGNKKKAAEIEVMGMKAVAAMEKHRAEGHYNKEEQQEVSLWIKKEYEKLSPDEIKQVKEGYFIPREFLRENVIHQQEIMDAQIKRTHSYSEEEAFGYCMRSLTSSLYKQQARYKTHDFLPKDAAVAMRNESFVSDYLLKKYPQHVFLNDETKTIGEVIDENNIKPGAIISLVRDKKPSHAMLYTHQDEKGEHFMMGFNNEVKNSNVSFKKNGKKHESFVIDIPSLIEASLSDQVKNMLKEGAMIFLGNMENKIQGSLVEKNFQDAINEGKKYSPEEQWNKFYKRSDVKFDVDKRIEEAKDRLKAKREGSSNTESQNTAPAKPETKKTFTTSNLPNTMERN